jgi:hypothetical protein
MQELLSQWYAHASRRTALLDADVLTASFDVGGLNRSAPARLREVAFEGHPLNRRLKGRLKDTHLIEIALQKVKPQKAAKVTQ